MLHVGSSHTHQHLRNTSTENHRTGRADPVQLERYFVLAKLVSVLVGGFHMHPQLQYMMIGGHRMLCAALVQLECYFVLATLARTVPEDDFLEGDFHKYQLHGMSTGKRRMECADPV